VALGGFDHDTQFPQVHSLMSTVAAGFHQLALVNEGDVLGEYHTKWDSRAEAIAAKGYSQLVWGSPVVKSALTLDRIGVTGDGSPVGSIRFTVDGVTTEVPVELEGSIEDPGPLWRLGNPFALAN
jgi:D-alanyl-D-alanine carboxypeptidase (penicillin-binding protein 5/6)